MIWYLDTSAASKLVAEEDESEQFTAWLDATDDEVTSSMCSATTFSGQAHPPGDCGQWTPSIWPSR